MKLKIWTGKLSELSTKLFNTTIKVSILEPFLIDHHLRMEVLSSRID